MELEVWKPVVEFEGYYEVSNFGRVRSVTRTDCRGQFRRSIVMRPGMARGYRLITLQRDRVRVQKLVHRVVAEVWLPKVRKEYDQINHIDGNKLNNKVANLEWCTSSYNTIHAYALGLAKGRKGITNPQARLSEEDVRQIRSMISLGFKGVQIARQFDVAPSVICKIKKGKLWKHLI